MKLEWGKPVMKLAAEGMTGTVYVCGDLVKIIEDSNKKAFSSFRTVFYTPDGNRFTSENDLIKYLKFQKK